MAKQTLHKKLTVASVFPDLRKVGSAWMAEGEASRGKSLFVGRFFGLARKVEIKTTDFGDSWKFSGEFRATDQGGDLHISSVLYLPDVIANPLADAVRSLEGNGDAEFAVDIVVNASHTALRGYTFEVSPLQEVRASDPLAALVEHIGLPHLPEDVAGEASETEPTPIEKAAGKKAPK